MSTTTPAPFSTQLIGQTEKALGAILDQQLAGTPLTEPLWVTMAVTAASGGTASRDQLLERLAGIFKISRAEADARLGGLVAAELAQAPDDAGSPVTLTDTGQQLYDRIRMSVAQITERLWGDLPAEDLAAAGRVLSTVLQRANAEHAGA